MKKHELENRASIVRKELLRRINTEKNAKENPTCSHTRALQTIALNIEQIINLSKVQNRLPTWVPSLFHPLFRRQGKINILMAESLSQTIRELNLILAEKAHRNPSENKGAIINATSN